MTLLPQSNARLLSVARLSGTSYSEDYDYIVGELTTGNDMPIDGVPVWRGNLDAYIQRKMRSNLNDRGQLDRVLEVTLFISGDLPVTIEEGDLLTYQAGNPTAPVIMAGRVQNITNPAYLPQLPDYYKCALEEIEVP